MNTDLDVALSRLAGQPVHPGLASLETDVMTLIAERKQTGSMTVRSGMLAAVGAAALGIAVGGLSPVAANAQVPSLSPFGPSVPLAPSTLLAFG